MKTKFVIIIILILIIIGGFYFYSKNKSLEITKEESDTQIISTTTIKSNILYYDAKYNFSFTYPNDVRLLTDMKGDEADPLIVSFLKDASLYSILVTDDEKQYPIPRMMQMSDEKININNIPVTKTVYYYDQTRSKISYIGYDFVIKGQSFLFAAHLQDVSLDKKKTEDLIEGVISTFKSDII